MNEIFKILDKAYAEGIAFEVNHDPTDSPAVVMEFSHRLKVENTPDETILLSKYGEAIMEVPDGSRDSKANGAEIIFAILKYQIERANEIKAKEYEEYKDL